MSDWIALISRNSVTGTCAARKSAGANGSLLQPSSIVMNATRWVVGIALYQPAASPAGTVIGTGGGAGGNFGIRARMPAGSPDGGDGDDPGDGTAEAEGASRLVRACAGELQPDASNASPASAAIAPCTRLKSPTLRPSW